MPFKIPRFSGTSLAELGHVLWHRAVFTAALSAIQGCWLKICGFQSIWFDIGMYVYIGYAMKTQVTIKKALSIRVPNPGPGFFFGSGSGSSEIRVRVYFLSLNTRLRIRPKNLQIHTPAKNNGIWLIPNCTRLSWIKYRKRIGQYTFAFTIIIPGHETKEPGVHSISGNEKKVKIEHKT